MFFNLQRLFVNEPQVFHKQPGIGIEELQKEAVGFSGLKVFDLPGGECIQNRVSPKRHRQKTVLQDDKRGRDGLVGGDVVLVLLIGSIHED